MTDLVLADYQADWPLQFAAAACELRAAFDGASVRIKHIGSTAVRGLCAKPACPRIHLHAVVLNSRIWRQPIRFRDALRGSALLAPIYTEAKAPFITRVLELH